MSNNLDFSALLDIFPLSAAEKGKFTSNTQVIMTNIANVNQSSYDIYDSNGGIITGVSSLAKTSLKKNAFVYVLVINGNRATPEYTILGEINKDWEQPANILDIEDEYVQMSENCFSFKDSSEGMDRETLSFNQQSDTRCSITKKIGPNGDESTRNNFLSTVKEHGYFGGKCKFLTNIHPLNRGKSSFGLQFVFSLDDETSQTYEFTNWDMVGNVFCLGTEKEEAQEQTFSFSIDDETKNKIVDLVEINLFYRDFYQDEYFGINSSDTLNAQKISVAELEIYGVTLNSNMDKIALSISARSVSTENSKSSFISNTDYVQLVATLKDVNNISLSLKDVYFLWFLKDDSVNVSSEFYHPSGGVGWKCLNPQYSFTGKENPTDVEDILYTEWEETGSTFNIQGNETNAPYFENIYKCVLVSDFCRPKDSANTIFPSTVTVYHRLRPPIQVVLSSTKDSEITDTFYKGTDIIDLSCEAVLTNSGYTEALTYNFDWTVSNSIDFTPVEETETNKNTIQISAGSLNEQNLTEIIVSCHVTVYQGSQLCFSYDIEQKLFNEALDGDTEIKTVKLYYFTKTSDPPSSAIVNQLISNNVTNLESYLKTNSSFESTKWHYTPDPTGRNKSDFPFCWFIERREVHWSRVTETNPNPTKRLKGYVPYNSESIEQDNLVLYTAFYQKFLVDGQEETVLWFRTADHTSPTANDYVYDSNIIENNNWPEWSEVKCYAINGATQELVDSLNTFNQLTGNGSVQGLFWGEGYIPTKDTKVESGKSYFTYNANDNKYTKVNTPTKENLFQYYEHTAKKSLYINADFIRSNSILVQNNNGVKFFASAYRNMVTIGGFEVDGTSIYSKNYSATQGIKISSSGTNFIQTPHFNVSGTGGITATACHIGNTTNYLDFSESTLNVQTSAISFHSNAEEVEIVLPVFDKETGEINGTTSGYKRTNYAKIADWTIGKTKTTKSLFYETYTLPVDDENANYKVRTSGMGSAGEEALYTSGASALDEQENHVVFWAGCFGGTPWEVSKNGGSFYKLTPFYVTSRGYMKATSGEIAGFKFDDISICKGTIGNNKSVLVSVGKSFSGSIGGSPTNQTWAFTSGKTFGVTTEGKIYASSGKVGPFTLDAYGFSYSSGNISESNIENDDIYYVKMNNQGVSAKKVSSWIFSASLEHLDGVNGRSTLTFDGHKYYPPSTQLSEEALYLNWMYEPKEFDRNSYDFGLILGTRVGSWNTTNLANALNYKGYVVSGGPALTVMARYNNIDPLDEIRFNSEGGFSALAKEYPFISMIHRYQQVVAESGGSHKNYGHIYLSGQLYVGGNLVNGGNGQDFSGRYNNVFNQALTGRFKTGDSKTIVVKNGIIVGFEDENKESYFDWIYFTGD